MDAVPPFTSARSNGSPSTTCSRRRGRRQFRRADCGGTSVGRVADLRPAWTELLGSRVCDIGRLLRGRWPFRMSEIVGGAATKYFGDRLLADTLIPLSIVVTQLGRSGFGRRALTARDPLPLATAILASCFLPGPYSRMVPIDRRLTVDGAWLGRVPVRELASSAPPAWWPA